MAKRNSSGAGGGINSRQRVEKPVKYGVNARAINERGVSQIGQSMGNHITEGRRKVDGAVEKVRGELRPAGGPGGIKLGNELAGNVGKGGPGVGREVMRSGAQGVHGQPNPGLGRIANTKGQWPDTRK
jgi:hypothetical protein